MKTGTKVFWVISACLVAIATSLVIAGIALGGTLEAPNTFRGFHVGTNWSRTNINDLQLAASDREVENHSYRTLYNGITNLDIETGVISTVIRTWEGSGINVDTSNLSRDVRRRLIVSQNGDILRIATGNRPRLSWGHNIGNEVLVIQVPEGLEFNRVSMDIGAGQVDVDQIFADRVDLTVGAGQIDVDALKADVLDISIGAGQGNIGDLEVRRTNMSVGAGQLDVTGALEERADIDCGVGEITFNVRGSQEDFGHSISVGIGEANFGTLSVSGLGRESTGNQHLDRMIDINVGIGSVTVNFMN